VFQGSLDFIIYFYFHILKELMLDFSYNVSTNNVLLCIDIRVKCVLIFVRFYPKPEYVD